MISAGNSLMSLRLQKMIRLIIKKW